MDSKFLFFFFFFLSSCIRFEFRMTTQTFWHAKEMCIIVCCGLESKNLLVISDCSPKGWFSGSFAGRLANGFSKKFLRYGRDNCLNIQVSTSVVVEHFPSWAGHDITKNVVIGEWFRRLPDQTHGYDVYSSCALYIPEQLKFSASHFFPITLIVRHRDISVPGW